MAVYWAQKSALHRNQVRRLIFSFSKNEISPDDPEAGYTAGSLVAQYLGRFHPHRQAAIFVQKDGKGGCVHVHAIVNDVDMLTYKAMGRVMMDGTNTDESAYYDALGVTKTDRRGRTYVDTSSFYFLRDTFDDFAAKYIHLDLEKTKAKEKRTQYERHVHHQPDSEKYLWKDDLRRRIRSAMSSATGREDYLRALSKNGVRGCYRTSKKAGDYILYELLDVRNFPGKVPDNLKSKSYKLGEDYGLNALDAMIRQNRTDLEPTPEDTPPAYQIYKLRTDRRTKKRGGKIQPVNHPPIENIAAPSTPPAQPKRKTVFPGAGAVSHAPVFPRYVPDVPEIPDGSDPYGIDDEAGL